MTEDQRGDAYGAWGCAMLGTFALPISVGLLFVVAPVVALVRGDIAGPMAWVIMPLISAIGLLVISLFGQVALAWGRAAGAAERAAMAGDAAGLLEAAAEAARGAALWAGLQPRGRMPAGFALLIPYLRCLGDGLLTPPEWELIDGLEAFGNPAVEWPRSIYGDTGCLPRELERRLRAAAELRRQ